MDKYEIELMQNIIEERELYKENKNKIFLSHMRMWKKELKREHQGVRRAFIWRKIKEETPECWKGFEIMMDNQEFVYRASKDKR